jgi:transcriptional regulator with XRE-family HTH domain
LNNVVSTYESIGQRIKRLRKERGLSQRELATMTNVTDSWISQIEQDKAGASPDLLNRIATAFKVPIRDILLDQGNHMATVSRLKLAEVLLETEQPNEADPIIAELLKESDLSHSDRLLLTVLLAECRYQQSHHQEALNTLLPFIESLESSNHHDTHFLARTRNIIGNVYFTIQDFTNAHYNYLKAYEYTLCLETFDSLAARIALNLSVVLRKIGKVSSSDDYLKKSYEFFKQANDLQNLAKTYFQQGFLSLAKKDYSLATESFESAKQLFHALNLQKHAAIVEHTIACKIIAPREPQLALNTLDKCITNFRKENDFPKTLLSLSKKATIQLTQKAGHDAFDTLSEALQLIETHALHQSPEAAETYKTLAQYSLVQDDTHAAIMHATRAAQIFEANGLITDQIHCLQIISQAYEQAGDYKNSLEYERQCSSLYQKLHKGEDQS